MRRRLFILLFCMLLFVSLIVADDACEVGVSVLNQDPYPAVPGEEVKVVFVVSGIDSTDCGTIEFEVMEEFPFSVSESSEKVYEIESGTFTKDYSTHKTIPVNIKVDEDAIDGENPLEVRYKPNIRQGDFSKRFDINVQDVRADFEVFVSGYNYATQEIKFEILNVGESDIEAVTVKVLNQENVKVYGTNIENIGDLSSNEDTSAEFKAEIYKSSIDLVISYSDSIQVRRTVEKQVEFNGELFESTKETKKNDYWKWIAGVVLVIIIIIFWRGRKKRKKRDGKYIKRQLSF